MGAAAGMPVLAARTRARIVAALLDETELVAFSPAEPEVQRRIALTRAI